MNKICCALVSTIYKIGHIQLCKYIEKILQECLKSLDVMKTNMYTNSHYVLSFEKIYYNCIQSLSKFCAYSYESILWSEKNVEMKPELVNEPTS